MRRDTDDLDLFTRPGAGVLRASEALVKWCAGEGLDARYLRRLDTFVRIQIEATDGTSTLVDLAEDVEPRMLVMTVLGPAPAMGEAASRKLLALFGRMEARDFADIYDLSSHVSKDEMVTGAAELDRGFDIGMLAASMVMIRRMDDREIPHPDPAAVRAFFEDWIAEIHSDRDS